MSNQTPFSSSSDKGQVFHLSLTEVVFILLFLLLFLLGLSVANLKDKLRESNEKYVSRAENQEIPDSDLREISVHMMQFGPGSSSEVIKVLQEAQTYSEQLQLLQKRLEDLDKVVKLMELMKASGVDTTSPEFTTLVETEKLDDSIRVYQQIVEHVKNSTALTGTLEDRINELLEHAATVCIDCKTDIASIEKQLVRASEKLAFYERQAKMRGGLDYPPCWINAASGKPEYVFSVTIVPKGVLVKQAWPPSRATEAANSKAIQRVPSKSSYSMRQFRSRTALLFSESQRDECRHYVILRNRVNDIKTFNSTRFAIEEVFYKFEPR